MRCTINPSPSAAAFFDPLPADGLLTPIIGPQGSPMFALAVRVSGIEPGDPEAVAVYRGRSGFRAVDGADGTFEHAQVFVIVDHSISTLRGEHLRVDALLTDSASAHRCGALDFRAGAE